MRALTIQQGWAWAIAEGLKTWENRSWATSYRGPLWIHAGRSRDWLAESLRAFRELGIEPPDEFAFGAVIARVEVVDCRKVADVRPESPWASGPWCHGYANVEKLTEPVPCKGMQGMFSLPAEVEARCFALLARD